MIVKLLTEHHLEFLSLKGGLQARLSLHMSKCHIVGNLMHWLIICLSLIVCSTLIRPLTLCLLVSSAGNVCKQFGPGSGRQKHPT